MPFSWGLDGDIQYSDRMTNEQIIAVEAVYKDHDPMVDAIDPKVDMSNIINLDKVTQALAFLIADFSGRTMGQVKDRFSTIYKSLI